MENEGQVIDVVIGVSHVDSLGILNQVLATLEPELPERILIVAIGKEQLETEDPRVLSIARPSDSDSTNDSIAVWNIVDQLHAQIGVVLNAKHLPKESGWLNTIHEQMSVGNYDVVLPFQSLDAFTLLAVSPLLSALYGRHITAPVPDTYAFTHHQAITWLKQTATNERIGHHPVLCAMCSSLANERKIVESLTLTPGYTLPNEDAAQFGKTFKQIFHTLFDHAISDEPLWRTRHSIRPELVLEGDMVNNQSEVLFKGTINDQFLIDHFCGASDTAQAEWVMWMTHDEITSVVDSMDKLNAGIEPYTWTRLLYSAIKDAHLHPNDLEPLIDSLLPLYYGRLLNELSKPTTFVERAEGLVQLKPELSRLW